MTAAQPPSAGTLAATAATVFVALYVVATGTGTGRGLDEDILNDALEGSVVNDVAHVLVSAVNPVTVAVATVAILWFAIARRGRGVAVALAATLLAANASAALLKMLLRETDPLTAETARDLGTGFYPSGHATSTMAIVLAIVVLVRPGRARARAAFAGGLAAGVLGLANVVAISHHASDVVGGLLLATMWVALMCAIVGPSRCGQRSMPREALAPAALASALGGVGAVVAAGLDWPAAPVAGAGGVCSIALLLAGAVAALNPAG